MYHLPCSHPRLTPRIGAKRTCILASTVCTLETYPSSGHCLLAVVKVQILPAVSGLVLVWIRLFDSEKSGSHFPHFIDFHALCCQSPNYANRLLCLLPRCTPSNTVAPGHDAPAPKHPLPLLLRC